MKKWLFLLVLPFLAVGAAEIPAADTGAAAPEFAVAEWIKGTPVKLADCKGKKPVALLIWTLSQKGVGGLVEFGRLAAKFDAKEVQFIAVAYDAPAAIRRCKALEEIAFPVGADDKLGTVNSYMRPYDRVPLVVLIDRKGVLSWRGEVELAEQPLREVLAGKFNLKEQIDREKFRLAVANAMQAKDFPTVIKLTDAELKRYPDRHDLLALKLTVLGRMQKNFDAAEQTAREAVARNPKDFQIYDMILQILRAGGELERLGLWYDRVIAAFPDQPMLLTGLAQTEMNQPIDKLRPQNAYKLCKAAWESTAIPGDRERGIIAGEYARALYFCSRADKALAIAQEAMKYLKDDKQELEQVKTLIRFLASVVQVSKSIQ